MSSPAAVTSGHAGLVVVLSGDAVRIACAERGWSLSELARRARDTRINPKVQSEAATFLTSLWATHLGELAGFSARTVWRNAQPERLRENDLRRAA